MQREYSAVRRVVLCEMIRDDRDIHDVVSRWLQCRCAIRETMHDSARQGFIEIEQLHLESQRRLNLLRFIVAAVCAAMFAVAGTILVAALCIFLSIGWGLHAISEPTKQPVDITLDPEAEKQFDEFRKVLWMHEAPLACNNGNFSEAQQMLDLAERHWPEWSSEYRAAYLYLRVVVFVELLKGESDPDAVRTLRDEIELLSTTLLAFLISMNDESTVGLKWNSGLAIEVHAARRYAEDYPHARPPNFEELVHR